MRLLDHGLADDGTVLEHVLKVYETAVVHVLRKIIRIVEMNEACFVSCYNIFIKKKSLGDILTYLTCHIVTLNAVDGGILIGILLLNLFVVALDEGQDLLVGRIGLTYELSLITISDIRSCDGKSPLVHDLVLDHILDLFHGKRPGYP